MPSHSPGGYSETPLAKKLNLRDGQRVWFCGMPDSVEQEIAEYALDLVFVAEPEEGVDAAHVFVTEREALVSVLSRLREVVSSDGQVWVSWPKKGSGAEGLIDEHDVREVGLELGFVDTKECAVDDAWSGLKLVIRKELR